MFLSNLQQQHGKKLQVHYQNLRGKRVTPYESEATATIEEMIELFQKPVDIETPPVNMLDISCNSQGNTPWPIASNCTLLTDILSVQQCIVSGKVGKSYVASRRPIDIESSMSWRIYKVPRPGSTWTTSALLHMPI